MEILGILLVVASAVCFIMFAIITIVIVMNIIFGKDDCFVDSNFVAVGININLFILSIIFFECSKGYFVS